MRKIVDDLPSRSMLPLECCDFAEQGERWALVADYNNVTMRVEKILISSSLDFEVEEIVCGGVAWDERPRDARRWRDGLESSAFGRMFQPSDPDRAVVPQGRHHVVIVGSSRATSSREEARVVSERSSGSYILAVAIGTTLHNWPERSDFRYADEATKRLFARASSQSERQCQIQAYLDQIRSARSSEVSAGAGAGTPALDRRASRRSERPDDVRVLVDREFENWE